MKYTVNQARQVALETIETFLDKQEYHLAERTIFHKPADAALYFSIVKQTIRHLQKYKFYLSLLINKKPSNTVYACLLIALAQLDETMDIAPHAVVFESVALIKNQKSKKARTDGFVNGVLQNFLRSRDSFQNKLEQQSISTQYSYPQWLTSKWQKQWGEKKTKELCLAGNIEPTLQITLLNEQAQSNLEKEGFTLLQLEENIFEVPKPRALFETDSFKQGDFFVQDISVALLWRILLPLAKETILDLCSAPGGKLFQWEHHFANEIKEIVSIEKNKFRFQVLEENAKRLSSQATLVKEDALTWQSNKLFDIVILDTPCSATGTIRKNPDIKWKRTKKDVLSTQELQKTLLLQASKQVKTQGHLLYITCSLEKEENEDIVAWFLQTCPFYSIVTIQDSILEKHNLIDSSFYRSFPTKDYMGSFAALFCNTTLP